MNRPWTSPDPVLVRVARLLEPGQALDVGCGGGHDSFWLARNGWSVTAIDISRHAVDKVRKAAREQDLDLTAKKVDVTTLDVEGKYDLVSICYMHLPDEERALMLGKGARSLKPGGTLLFRSFEVSISEAPFDRELLPRRNEVVRELSPVLEIREAEVTDEFFPYLNKVMRLLTIVAERETMASGLSAE